MKSKASAKDYPLTLEQLLELDGGPDEHGSAFADEAELRLAWAANSERILHRYAFDLHDAGQRPEVYWYLTADTTLGPAADWREEDRLQPARLRYLLEHDAFLPGELEQIERVAKQERAAAAELAIMLRPIGDRDRLGKATEQELERAVAMRQFPAMAAWAIVSRLRGDAATPSRNRRRGLGGAV